MNKDSLIKKKKKKTIRWSKIQTFSHDIIFSFREREREIFGPKKRGPKLKTFLLKVNVIYLLICFDRLFW